MTRTAQQYFWLQDHHFREKLKAIIQFYCRVYYVELIRFTVLGNHYHTVVKCMKPTCDAADVRRRFELAQARLKHPQKWDDSKLEHYHQRFGDISKLAWEINYHSAALHNKENGTSGHLWGSRFKSQIIEDGDNLLEVMAYVDLNAVAANMVEDPADYPFCSAREDMEALRRGDHPVIYPAGFLQNYAAKDRAACYMLWLQCRAQLKRGKPVDIGALKINQVLAPKSPGSGLVRAEDLMDLVHSSHQRLPPQWSMAVFGSATFVAEITGKQVADTIPEMTKPSNVNIHGDRAPPD